MKPTKRQKTLLDFISDFIDKHGYSPSYREIKDGLGYTSLATVSLHVHGLIDRGYLRNKYNYGRTLEIVGADELLLEKSLRERYSKLTITERQIVIRALNILGYHGLTKTLK